MSTRLFLLPVCAAMLALGPACASMAEEKEGKEENSTPMTLDQLPAAVRKTMEEQAAGNKLEEIEKEVEEGKTVYEAEVKIDGKDYEISVAEDGKLISKKAEEEDDAEGKDDDKDDKDDEAEKKV
jgi:uncharacterized membrane protein YkoI